MTNIFLQTSIKNFVNRIDLEMCLFMNFTITSRTKKNPNDESDPLCKQFRMNEMISYCDWTLKRSETIDKWTIIRR